MKYLFSDNYKSVLAQTLAYVVAPRINAGGRMGDANCALKLFISKDPNEIFDLAVKLNQYNTERQVECDVIYREAKEKIQKYSLHKRNVILVKDQNWKTGFVGIVAARLVEEYSRPVIVFAGQDDYFKGSARSVDGINIFDAITANKEHLIGFGGHAQAAGVSVQKENFAPFERALNDFVKNEYKHIDVKPSILVEWEIDGEISKQFAKEIELLEPFGVGNRSPLFSVSANKIKANRLKENSPHFSFRTDYIEMLNFNGEKDVEILNLPVDKKIIFEINRSTFKNKEYIKGYVKSVLADYENFDGLNLYALNNQLECYGEETCEYKFLDKTNLPPDNGGTLYVISDPNNLKYYPQLSGLEKSFDKVKVKSFNSQIIYAPKQIPEWYERVIYLDKPIFIKETGAKTYVVKDLIGYKLIDKLSTDRSDFAKAFNLLLSLKNKPITDTSDFAKENATEEISEENLLFALKVFIELKIFSIQGERLIHDPKIKNALTNSKVYSKIVLLKESYV